jgi:threonine dehydrogenase-like Zn-dependent dehydrogenase
MKQAVVAAPRTFEIEDVPPPVAGAGEVLVRVRSVGICGSDLHFYRGAFPLPPRLVLGHEAAGEVAAIGDGVTGVEVGARVALELFRVCLVCEQCRSGNYHLCPSRKANGLTGPGALREYMTVPPYALYPLPPEVDFDLGALTEPLAVCVHGLRLADLRFGERVAVLGAGTIGLMAVAAAKAMGATWVGCSARHPHQKSMAAALGADMIVGDGPAAIAELTKAAAGADIVVETVGGEADTLSQAMNVIGPSGRICVLGAFTKPVQLHPIMFFLKEARIVGSNCYGRPGRRSDYELAIEIMRRDPARMRGAITHRFPLDEVAQAYAIADDKQYGAIKVQISP